MEESEALRMWRIIGVGFGSATGRSAGVEAVKGRVVMVDTLAVEMATAFMIGTV